MSNFFKFESNSFMEFSSLVLLTELDIVKKTNVHFYYNNFVLFSNNFIKYLKKIKKEDSIKDLEDSFFNISLKNKEIKVKYDPKEDILEVIKLNKELQSLFRFQRQEELPDEETIQSVTKHLFREIGIFINNKDSYFDMFLNIIHSYKKETKEPLENILYKLEYISGLFDLSHDTINSLKTSLK